MRLRTPLACAVILLLASCAGGDPVSTETDLAATPSGSIALAKGVDAPGCRPDDKLLGRFLLSGADDPSTWWGLTKGGFVAAGITDFKGFIESAFGQSFATEQDAINALVNVASATDRNGNGYICAHNLRGTRTNFGDPMYANYLFKTYDDDHVK